MKTGRVITDSPRCVTHFTHRYAPHHLLPAEGGDGSALLIWKALSILSTGLSGIAVSTFSPALPRAIGATRG
jgi:hypothetical protein